MAYLRKKTEGAQTQLSGAGALTGVAGGAAPAQPQQQSQFFDYSRIAEQNADPNIKPITAPIAQAGATARGTLGSASSGFYDAAGERNEFDDNEIEALRQGVEDSKVDPAKKLVGAKYEGPAGLDGSLYNQQIARYGQGAQQIGSQAGLTSYLKSARPTQTGGQRKFDSLVYNQNPAFQGAQQGLLEDYRKTTGEARVAETEAQTHALGRVADETDIADRSKGWVDQYRSNTTAGVDKRIAERQTQDANIAQLYERLRAGSAGFGETPEAARAFGAGVNPQDQQITSQYGADVFDRTLRARDYARLIQGSGSNLANTANAEEVLRLNNASDILGLGQSITPGQYQGTQIGWDQAGWDGSLAAANQDRAGADKQSEIKVAETTNAAADDFVKGLSAAQTGAVSGIMDALRLAKNVKEIPGILSTAKALLNGQLDSAIGLAWQTGNPAVIQRATEMARQFGSPSQVPSNYDLAGDTSWITGGGSAAFPALAAVPGGAGFGSAAGGAANALGVSAVPGGVTNAAVGGAGSAATGAGASLGGMAASAVAAAGPAVFAFIIGQAISSILGKGERNEYKRQNSRATTSGFAQQAESGWRGLDPATARPGDAAGQVAYLTMLLDPQARAQAESWHGPLPQLSAAGERNAREALYRAHYLDIASPKSDGRGQIAFFNGAGQQTGQMMPGYGTPQWEAEIDRIARERAGIQPQHQVQQISAPQLYKPDANMVPADALWKYTYDPQLATGAG